MTPQARSRVRCCARPGLLGSLVRHLFPCLPSHHPGGVVLVQSVFAGRACGSGRSTATSDSGSRQACVQPDRIQSSSWHTTSTISARDMEIFFDPDLPERQAVMSDQYRRIYFLEQEGGAKCCTKSPPLICRLELVPISITTWKITIGTFRPQPAQGCCRALAYPKAILRHFHAKKHKDQESGHTSIMASQCDRLIHGI